MAVLRAWPSQTPWSVFLSTVHYVRRVLTTLNYRKANSALTHQTLGIIILPTVVAYSKVLARLAIGLDKQPHLIAHLIPKPASGDDSGPRETLPERAANLLRQAFVTCLNDRSGSSSATTTDRDGKTQHHPEGKRRGIYTIANLCLKILFACRKTRGAAQIFDNIYNQSPPLEHFPKAERVTFLYYLGRFLWANSHFYRALTALQSAFDLCHVRCLGQRRLILVYLVAANLVCGRFPSAALLSRPEAKGLRERFEPLCRAIARGDIAGFRRLLTPGSPEQAWFAFYRIDIQLRNRCEVYVWRSLVRKCFILCGDAGNPEQRKAPTLDLNALVAVWRWQERKWITLNGQSQPEAYIDPDFEGLISLDPTAETAWNLPDMTSIISKMSSLIHQDLLNGYLSLRMQKFAIQGARQKGALAGGFPNVWRVVKARSDGEVPGWKREIRTGVGGARTQFGPGQVVNLSGVRPVGMA